MTKISIFMPIRLGSQRIKKKSVIDFFGRPLFCWSLQTLDSLGHEVYVYTNDEKELLSVLDFTPKNVKFLKRPTILDTNSATGIDIYKSFASSVKSDVYMLAHCTSPFVSAETYRKVINKVIVDGFSSSCTVEKKQTFCWKEQQPVNFSLPRERTQDLEPVFVETSAAYCYKREVLDLNSRTSDNNCFVESNFIESLDIDDESDLEILKLKYIMNTQTK